MIINGKPDINGAYFFEKLKFCKKCGLETKSFEPDPCLGYIPDVAHACCGHGDSTYGEDWQAYCCGWPGCKPNEGPGEYNVNRLSEIPGYWDKRGKEALKYMESLNDR